MHIHPATLNLNSSGSQFDASRAEAARQKRSAEDRRKKLLANGAFSDAMVGSENVWLKSGEPGTQDPPKQETSRQETSKFSEVVSSSRSYWA